MLRTLANTELQQVSGGDQYYFPAVPGYEIVGVDVQIVGYDVQYSFLTETLIPILSFEPIYSPITTTTIYYY